jgi:uracil-DNA glycosylase
MSVRPSGPLDAKIMIVGEAPGENEIQTGIPFSGASGMELNRMLAEVGLSRGEVFVTNVCRERPRNNDISNFIALKKKDVTINHVPLRDKMVLPVVREGYKLLKWEIEQVKPNIIIACGNVSMWALTGKWGITDWRGSELWTDQIVFEDGTSPTVIPIYHPAAVLRQWDWRNVVIHDLKKVKRMAGSRIREKKVLNIKICTRVQELNDVINSLICTGVRYLSVDIETKGDHISCIGFAWSDVDALVVPICTDRNKDGYWSAEEELAVIQSIREWLRHPNTRIIGQNFSFDSQFIERWWGYMPIVAHDTLIAQHSMFSNLPKDLGYLASLYCSPYVNWKNWSKNMGEQALWAYNGEDCCKTYEIAMGQMEALKALNLEHVNQFQQSLFGPIQRAMSRGVKIDVEAKGKLSIELQAAIAEREQWLIDVIGHPLNPNSPKQMHAFFAEDLKIKPKLKRRSNGNYTPSYDDESLRFMAGREPIIRPIVEMIADIRSLRVFNSTFVMATLDWDQRIRCSYNIGGTITYRLSSNSTPFDVGMNLQNIPKGDE